MGYKISVEFPHVSGLPHDAAVNTFAVDGPGHPAEGSTDAGIVLDAIRDFYNDTPTGETHGLAWYMSSVLSRLSTAVIVRAWNPSATGLPRTLMGTFTLGPAGSSVPLPSEVAYAISWRKKGAVGIQARSQRGRIYLGPLNENAAETITGVRRPDANLRDIAVAQALALVDRISTAFTGASLAVYSPKLDEYFPIDEVSVDDAFDTIRKRGESRTAIYRNDVP